MGRGSMINQEVKEVSLDGKIIHKTYEILGRPIAWARAGQNKGRYYDKQIHLKRIVWAQLAQQHGNSPAFTGPISIQFMFYMPLANSLSKKKKESLSNTYHHCIPDLSNLVKFYEDAAKGILFKDDAQIAHMQATKVYAPESKVLIYIKSLE